MSEGGRIFAERLNPQSENFQAAIKTLSRPPERELTEQDKFEVLTFEQSLARGEVPFGILAPDRVRHIEKGIPELSDTVKDSRICIDYFMQDEVFTELFPDQYPETLEQKRFIVQQQFARTHPDKATRKAWKSHRIRSQRYARTMLEQQVSRRLEDSPGEEGDPILFRVLENPQEFLDKATSAKDLRGYLRDIDKQLGSGRLDSAKKIMLDLHRERVNTMIASLYRHGITLLNQDRWGNILTDEQREQFFAALPALRPGVNRNIVMDESGIIDHERLAGKLDRLDRFMNGVDRTEAGHDRIGRALRDVAERQEQPPIEHPDYVYADVDPELLRTRKVDAAELAEMARQVLGAYGLLSEVEEYDKKRKGRAADNKWQVVIDDEATSSTVSVTPRRGIIEIPAKFNRTLNNISPAGALPCLDHEITHVIQAENGEKLGLGLFKGASGARSGAWFEGGAVSWETVSQERLFGQDRGVNLFYLAALEKRLDGGSMTDSAEAAARMYMRQHPEVSQESAVAHTVDRTMRLFRNGGELTLGTRYAAETSVLEYAEQAILADALPRDMWHLFYIGKVSLGDLAKLHSLGLIQKEKLLLPERLPSDILEPYVRENILSKPGQ